MVHIQMPLVSSCIFPIILGAICFPSFGDEVPVVEKFQVFQGERPSGPYYQLSLSPTKPLVAASTSYAIRVWNTESGNIIRNFDGFRISFSPDGRYLAVTSRPEKKERLRLYDTSKWIAEQELPIVDAYVFAFASDGKRMVTASRANEVKLWDVDKGNELGAFRCIGPVYSMAVSPDDTLLAIGTQVGEVCVYNLKEGKEKWRPDKGVFCIDQLLFAPDGKSLVSVSRGLKTYDVNTGNLLKRFDLSETVKSGCNQVAFVPKTNLLALAGNSLAVHVFDALSTRELLRLRAENTELMCVAVTPDGRTVIAGDGLGLVRMWKLPELKALTPPK